MERMDWKRKAHCCLNGGEWGKGVVNCVESRFKSMVLKGAA